MVQQDSGSKDFLVGAISFARFNETDGTQMALALQGRDQSAVYCENLLEFKTEEFLYYVLLKENYQNSKENQEKIESISGTGNRLKLLCK